MINSFEVTRPAGILARLAKPFAVACVLAFGASQGRAQALFEVTTNASDNSAGSLGAALTAAGSGSLILFNPFISPVIAPTASYGNAFPLTLDGNQLTVNFVGGMSVNTGGVLSLIAADRVRPHGHLGRDASTGSYSGVFRL